MMVYNTSILLKIVQIRPVDFPLHAIPQEIQDSLIAKENSEVDYWIHQDI